MKYVKYPNLPENAKIVLLGEKYAKILGKPLEKLGIEPLFVPDNPNVSDMVSGHADISVLHLGYNKLVLAKYLKGSSLAETLSNLGMTVQFLDTEQGEKYPKDSSLNLCICGENLFYNPKSANSAIVDFLTNEHDLKKRIIKQGYSKCSVCVVSKNAIITADEGINKRAVEAGIDCLKIAPGFIDLPGYDYGFIGGATFKLDKYTMAFTGSLDFHPDKDNILNFLSLHNVKPVYITERSIFDVGSVIQIVEK